MRRVKQAVPLAECRKRALQYLAGLHRLELTKASAVAGKIWPSVEFHAQGAGAAASRILRGLQKDGLAEWSADTTRNDWGYRITPSGRSFLEVA
jgi:hypothetical protein